MTQAHGVIARVSNRTPDGSYSDEHDLGEARSLGEVTKGEGWVDARHTSKRERIPWRRGKLGLTRWTDEWCLFNQPFFFLVPRDPDRVCIDFLVSWRKMGAFNPRHRLRSRVNPARQMSQGEPRTRRRLQPTIRADIREDQSGGGGDGDGGGDLLVAPPIGTNDSPEGREKWYEGRTNAANKSETRFLLAKFLLDKRRIGKRDFLPTGVKQNNQNKKRSDQQPLRGSLRDWKIDD